MTPEQSAALHRRYFLSVVGDGITPEYALQLTCAYIQATELAGELEQEMPSARPTIVKQFKAPNVPSEPQNAAPETTRERSRTHDPAQ